MNRRCKCYFRVGLGIVSLLTMVSGAIAQRYPNCSQDHPGKQHRAESVLKRGDSRMTLSVASHTTTYARQRYNLGDLVTQTDIDRAQKEMYDFLSWKLGNPLAVATQFVSAGYQHFDKAYVDEAAAALLGVELPGPGKVYRLPKPFSDFLKQKCVELETKMCQYIADSLGIPQELCKPVVDEIRNAIANAIDRIGFSMPKNWDVDNKLVQALIEAKRTPPRLSNIPPITPLRPPKK